MIALVLALLLGAGDAAAATSETARTGWRKQTAALLFYDNWGNLSNDVGLGHWEDTGASSVTIRDLTAGTSSNGEFAWLWEVFTDWNIPRTKLLGRRSLLRFYGSAGREIWSASGVEAPGKSDPLVYSANGENILLAQKSPKGWLVSVRTYLGIPEWELGPFPELDSMFITPSGRYAMIRWTVPDKSRTHTFLELPTKTRKDVASGELHLGSAIMWEDGKVTSGKREVFAFPKPTAEPPAPGIDAILSTAPVSEAPPEPRP